MDLGVPSQPIELTMATLTKYSLLGALGKIQVAGPVSDHHHIGMRLSSVNDIVCLPEPLLLCDLPLLDTGKWYR